jgi:hypothetical protein
LGADLEARLRFDFFTGMEADAGFEGLRFPGWMDWRAMERGGVAAEGADGEGGVGGWRMEDGAWNCASIFDPPSSLLLPLAVFG